MTSVTVDGAGQEVQRTAADGVVTAYRYDTQGRRIGAIVGSGAQAVQSGMYYDDADRCRPRGFYWRFGAPVTAYRVSLGPIGHASICGALRVRRRKSTIATGFVCT